MCEQHFYLSINGVLKLSLKAQALPMKTHLFLKPFVHLKYLNNNI